LNIFEVNGGTPSPFPTIPYDGQMFSRIMNDWFSGLTARIQ